MKKGIKNLGNNLKLALVDDCKTKNKDFAFIVLECLIIAVCMFISIYCAAFVYVATALLCFCVLFQFNYRSLYFIVGFVPLINLFYYNYGSFNLLAIPVVCVVAVSCVRLLWSLFLKQQTIKIVPTVLLAALIGLMLISSSFQHLSSIFGVLCGLMFVYLLLYFSHEVDSKELIYMFLLGIFASIFIGLFRNTSSRLDEFAMLYSANGIHRFGGITNPNFLADEMMLAFAFLCVLKCKDQIKVLFYPIFTILYITLIFTISKSGLIIFSVTFLLFAIVYLLYKFKKIKFVALTMVVCIIAVTSTVFYSRIGIYLDRFVSVFEKYSTTQQSPTQQSPTIPNPDIGMDSSGERPPQVDTDKETIKDAVSEITTGRLDLWIQYYEKITEDTKHLLIGYGADAEDIGVYAHYTNASSHNTFLQILYYYGVVGLLLMLAFIASVVNWKQFKKHNLLVILPLAALALYMCCDNILGYKLFVYVALLVMLTKSEQIIKNDNSNKRILHLLTTSTYSGAENVACQIIDMCGENVECVYCSPKGKIEESLKEKNISFLGLNSFSVKTVADAIKTFNPDIIHAHDIKAIAMAALVGGNVPIIAHVHTSGGKIMTRISIKSLVLLFASKKANHVFWVSKSCYSNYAFRFFLKRKSSVLYNIISIKALENKAKSDKENYKNDVIYIGRITEVKNPMRLMNILKMLVEKKKDVCCNVVGDGEMRNQCEEFVNANNLQKNIKFLGFVTNPYKLLSQSKVMLMSSIVEGTPMCAIESLCMGVPVVSTPTDGLVDLINVGQTGFIYSTDEDAVKFLIDIIDGKIKLKQECLDFSAKYNNEENYINKILAAYDNCLRGKYD